MKVILTADVKNIGQKGDKKKVKPGFARNFLLPRGLAVTAESVRAKEIISAEEMKKQEKVQKDENIDKIITQNKDLEISFRQTASEEGKLFGSVTAKEIKEAVKKKIGIKVDSIEPNSAIKEIGDHQIIVKFKGGGTLQITTKISGSKSKKK